ncbi:hypothetical protein N3K66_006356 [Trichothecium roseum]|uniref:Uncharacterized protein n=1 Tax=Trichothecium roseum TaxID=47278 RepID=A0ACC0UV57_9HYPO|nr:hypothetical protein N3K66_006356 [Trichothecium roseum]
MKPHLITTNLWFSGDAEEAAKHYVSIFPDSSVDEVHRYGGSEVSAVTFTLSGAPFVAINGGGDAMRFTAAVSFQVEAENQAEVDGYWAKLGAGADESKQAAGWLVDKYGISWQVTPKQLTPLLKGEKAAEVAEAMLQMKKIDIAKLEAI